MKLYQSPDGVWTGTQADAKAHAKANATTWEEAEVAVDKAGLMAFLNLHRVGGSGRWLFPPKAEEQTAPAQRTEPNNYTEYTMTIDDVWDKLPLPRKLFLASLALSEAQDKIK